MRKKLVGFIILIIAISLLAIGLINGEYLGISNLYDKMSALP